MDFQSLISTAQQNLSSTREKGKFYSTKFEPPKKVTKEKRLSAGIQKFLEEKKREEEENARKARQKMLDLVSRRDPKEQRKIDKTLKVIKSSKKFYTGDSTLDENTAVTLENQQPDEDDYGYTSTTSDQFHKKLLEKYHNLPEDKKFSSSSSRVMSKAEIQNTKDRVKNSFASKDEEHHHFKQGPQQRTSKVKSEKLAATSTNLQSDKRNGTNPKPKLKPAPIVDFQELLKLAEQKQHEEITIEAPVKKEPERLLTMKEKRELEEMEAAKKARMKPNRIPKLGTIPKVGEPSKHDKNNNESSVKKLIVPNGNVQTKQSSLNRTAQSNSDKVKRPVPSTASSKLRDALQKQNGTASNPKVPSSSKSGTSSSSIVKTQRDSQSKISSLNTQKPASSINSAKIEKQRPSTSFKEPPKTREFPPKDLLRTKENLVREVNKTREFPPKDVIRSREFPPKDVMRSRDFPPKDVMRSRDFPPKDLKRKSTLIAKKRRIEDEESDYDSEMDDFIDDGDCEQDYSSEIKKIFGYDKSRYRDEDFDDSQMESDYRTVMREEFISKKLGLMEDLEDMKMEAEEKKRKEMRKKRKL